MSTDLHGAALDALTRRDDGLPPVDGDGALLAALDGYLGVAHTHAVAAAQNDWEAGHAARWPTEEDQ